MALSNKKLYLALALLTIIIGLMLYREIRNYQSITTSASSEPLIADNSTPLPLGPTDKPLGYVAAPITIVEYLDLGSQHDRQIHNELSNFVRKNPDKIRLFFKHAPVTHLFSDGALAHKAVFCAGLQHKTPDGEALKWDYLDILISKNYNLRESGLDQAAADSGLNIQLWSNCLQSDNTAAAINKDFDEAIGLQLGAPPLIFINNKKLNTKLDINLTDLLSSLIAK